jgi:hypothetical protein
VDFSVETPEHQPTHLDEVSVFSRCSFVWIKRSKIPSTCFLREIGVFRHIHFDDFHIIVRA